MSQINVNKIADKTGGGAPEFPYGIQVTGIVTATTLNQNVVGVVTASGGFSGDLTGNVTGDATGLSGSPNIVVSSADVTGIGTINDLRLESVSDKITVSTGNSPSLAYNTGGGNVAVVYDATGPITLTVTGVPTTADFNNRALNFSVIVRQGATGYACTSLVVNGTSFSSAYTVGTSTCITYPGGTVATGSTTGYDIFNFVGVNTTGSAADITNYNFLSVKNGDFRLYA
jgi:hypothetical protein